MFVMLSLRAALGGDGILVFPEPPGRKGVAWDAGESNRNETQHTPHMHIRNAPIGHRPRNRTNGTCQDCKRLDTRFESARGEVRQSKPGMACARRQC